MWALDDQLEAIRDVLPGYAKLVDQNVSYIVDSICFGHPRSISPFYQNLVGPEPLRTCGILKVSRSTCSIC